MPIPSLPRRAEQLAPGQSPDNVSGSANADPNAPDNGRGANLASVIARLGDLSVVELLDLRSAVDAKLPARALKDIDLEQELVLQLIATQELQRTVLAATDTPANQLAQVSNAVQSALQNLVKLQETVYTTERLKRIEIALVDCINTHLTTEQAELFLAGYRKALESGK
jgi:hypothetical protein